MGEMQVMLKVASRDIPFIRDYTFPQAVSSDDLGVSLEQYAREARLTHGSRIGTAGARLMPKFLYERMQKVFAGSYVEDRDDLLIRMRRHKSDVEKAIMAEGLQKTQQAFRRVLQETVPGGTRGDFIAKLEYQLRMAGCQDVDILVGSSGSRSLGMAGNQLLNREELIRAYLAVQYLGYWVETGQTFSLDHSRSEHRESYRKVYNTLQESLEKVRPGARARDVVPTPEFSKYGWGQGMGTDREESPFLTDTSEELAESDVMSLRVSSSPNAREEIFLAQMTVVTEDGYRLLGERLSPDLLVV